MQSNGVTFEGLDEYGLVTLSGTSSTSTTFERQVTFPAGSYRISQHIIMPNPTVTMYDVYARTQGEAGGDQWFISFRNDVFRVTERRDVAMEIFLNEDKTMDDYRIRFTLRSQ